MFIILHLALEGYRWQMLPTYALAAILFLVAVKSLVKGGSRAPVRAASRKRALLRFSIITIGLLLFVLAAALPALFPVFRMPRPSGYYVVGTTRFSLTDEARAETFTADPSDRREIPVQCWYPAEPDVSAKPEALWQPADEIGRQAFGRAAFLLGHLNLVRTHSYPDAPVARSQSSYPVPDLLSRLRCLSRSKHGVDGRVGQ